MRPVDRNYFTQEHAVVEFFSDGRSIIRHGLRSQSHFEKPFVSRSEKHPSNL